MKLKAVYLLSPEALDSVYGAEERRDVARAVDLLAPPSSAAETLALGDSLREVEAIFSGWGVPKMDEAFLQRFPALRVVFHAAGSVKAFATDRMWERGVRVTCAARMNAIPVAEFSVSQILFSLKHGWQRFLEVRARRSFVWRDDHMPGVYQSTVGLLSLGHTGRLVAELLRSYELRVIAYDPYCTEADARSLGVELMSLEDVFAQSHVVSCHTPLLPQTRGLLRGRHFASLRRGATFLNTARGAVVNEPELIEVLRERPDLFAVLDVTDPEPPDANSPLFTLPNVAVTPHIAGSLGRECRRMGRMMVEEAQRYSSDLPLTGEVFPRQLATLA